MNKIEPSPFIYHLFTVTVPDIVDKVKKLLIDVFENIISLTGLG